MAELFCMVFVPLVLILFWIGRIAYLLERIEENTRGKEGEQK